MVDPAPRSTYLSFERYLHNAFISIYVNMCVEGEYHTQTLLFAISSGTILPVANISCT